MSKFFPIPVQGSLQLYQVDPVALPYVDTDPHLPHSLVFVPGLGDTLASCPYMAKLADMLRRHDYSLVMPQLTCNLGGWGQSSLEGDAQEIAACIAHLRSTPSKKEGKVVLMGHSTGCQDSIAYLLSSSRAIDPRTRINGVVLQAPVSDRESYERRREEASKEVRAKMDKILALATKLVQEGKGALIMPSDDESIAIPLKPADSDDFQDTDSATNPGNSAAVLAPATTAYRFWSLYAKGGDDDFFSSDLSDSSITTDKPNSRSFGRAIRNLQAGANTAKPRILALMGEQE